MESFDEMQRALEEKGHGDGVAAGPIDFYRDVLVVQRAHLERSETVQVRPGLHDAIARVERGLPACEPWNLLIDPKAFRSLFADLVGVMDKHGLLGAEDRWRLEGEARALDQISAPIPLLSDENRAGGSDHPLPFLFAAVQFPFLKSYADALLPHLKLPLWQKGICPICGDPPGFAVLTQPTRERSLVCSRCGTTWPFKRLCCPFCGNERQELLSYIPVSEGRYRVFLCDQCHRYLKAMDLAEVGSRPVSPFIESLLSEEMDDIARSWGYRDTAEK